jgi:putative endonuclease
MGRTNSVYILSNWKFTVLYTGVTNDLFRRVFEHKVKLNKGFTSKYNCNKLLYYEEFGDVMDAINREKQIKKYKRAWKKNLINSMNPEWKDLSEGWYDQRELANFTRD